MYEQKIATVFGGTGFVGRQIVRELAKKNVIVKIATRVPESAFFLKPCGAVGQVVPIACDYSDDKSISAAVKGSDYVINCIGVLFQRGKNTFQRAHVDIPTAIAKACKKHKAAAFSHISALGCDVGTSKYAQSKLAGEAAIKKAFPAVSILRPSIIFGEDDNFFNQFAHLAMFSPVLPLIGGGQTKFQPVYVGDVADAVMVTLNHTQAQGQVFELGGPEVLTFEALYKRMLSYTQQTPILAPLPFGLAKFNAFFLSMLPTPLLTIDQVESLKTDVVVGDDALGLDTLEIEATGLDSILPRYLTRYRRGGRFGDRMSA